MKSWNFCNSKSVFCLCELDSVCCNIPRCWRGICVLATNIAILHSYAVPTPLPSPVPSGDHVSSKRHFVITFYVHHIAVQRTKRWFNVLFKMWVFALILVATCLLPTAV